jgi:GNAT superfamily N-acetyltransferase
MPLADEAEEVVNPVRDAGHNIHQWFYFAESVLLPEYRGRRLGHRFFIDRLVHASDYGYKAACFCAVVRPDDHPQRPSGYRPLDGLWTRHGFNRADDIKTYFSWKEFGETTESPKPMEYWVRKL